MTKPESIKRVLLKISGESLTQPGADGLDPDVVAGVAKQIKSAGEQGVQIAVVCGAGNLIRGAEFARLGTNRAAADQMGMLATAINCLALQDALERLGVETRAASAMEMKTFMEPYVRRRAMRHLEKNRVVILAGGTGNPYFTTDTAAALRATELGVDLVLKATKVDGVYTADPGEGPDRHQDPRDHLQVGALDQRPAGHGSDGLHVVHGERHADHGVRHVRGRKPRAGGPGRVDRDLGRCPGLTVDLRTHHGRDEQADPGRGFFDKIDKSIQHLTDQLRTIRTGRAAPALVETIKVDYYGTATPIQQLAHISVPEPRQLVLKPFDPSLASARWRSRSSSPDLGLTPSSDGKTAAADPAAALRGAAHQARRPGQEDGRGLPRRAPQRAPRGQQARRPGQEGRQAHRGPQPRPPRLASRTSLKKGEDARSRRS